MGLKWGHTEAHLSGANPGTWKWRLRETVWQQPELVILVGAGGVLLICIGALLYIVLEAWERRHPPE